MEAEKENKRIGDAVKDMCGKISSSIYPKGHILHYLFEKTILTTEKKKQLRKFFQNGTEQINY